MALAEAEDLKEAAGGKRGGSTKRYVSTRRKNKPSINSKTPARPRP